MADAAIQRPSVRPLGRFAPLAMTTLRHESLFQIVAAVPEL